MADPALTPWDVASHPGSLAPLCSTYVTGPWKTATVITDPSAVRRVLSLTPGFGFGFGEGEREAEADTENDPSGDADGEAPGSPVLAAEDAAAEDAAAAGRILWPAVQAVARQATARVMAMTPATAAAARGRGETGRTRSTIGRQHDGHMTHYIWV
jgi:hypothetical protein